MLKISIEQVENKECNLIVPAMQSRGSERITPLNDTLFFILSYFYSFSTSESKTV